MKRKNTKIILLILITLSITMSLSLIANIKYAYANPANDDLQRREMLIDTAEAYYRKNENYQYDLYRENKFLSPEEINSYNKSYAVCSTFVFQVYYNTLGIKIPILSKNHLNNALALNENNKNEYIRYYTKTNIKQQKGTTTKEKIESFEKFASTYLEKGDVVTIGYGKNGHTLMVYEVKKGSEVLLIHNNGNVYDYQKNEEKYEQNGSIRIEKLSDIIKTSFISNNDFTFDGISFIKIIADGKYLSFSNSNVKQLKFPNNDLLKSGKTRYKYKDMDVEKTYLIKNNDCSITSSLYANLNSEITYTITIRNNSNSSYNGMKIIETIDESKVEYISSNLGTYEKGKITFSNINVKSKKMVNLTYTVKVKNILDNLYSKITSTGKIDETLNLKTININIGNTLSEYQKSIILLNYSKVNTNDPTGKEYVQKIYKNYFGYNIEFNKLFISYENSTKHVVKNTKVNNEQNIILANLYGLKLNDADNPYKNLINIYKAWRYWTYDTSIKDYIVTTDPNLLLEYKNRIRTLDYNMLETGDIILTNNTAYLYIVSNNQPKLILNGNEYNGKPIEVFLRDLVGDNYTILRPALNNEFIKKTYTITYISNENDVSNIPAPESYVYSTIDGCKFPITNQIPKREGYTFEGWMLDSNNTLIFKPATNWKQNNQRDYTLIATWKKNETSNSSETESNNNPTKTENEQQSTEKEKIQETENIIVYKGKLNNNEYAITIVSKNDKTFKELDGYQLSSDKKELSKIYKEEIKENIKVEFEDGQVEEIELKNTMTKNDKIKVFIPLILVLVIIILIIIIIKSFNNQKKLLNNK